MQNTMRIRLDLNAEQSEKIANLIFEMRGTISDAGRIQSLFSDADLLKEAIFAWNEKQTKL
jgi:hypothetical protein